MAGNNGVPIGTIRDAAAYVYGTAALNEAGGRRPAEDAAHRQG